MSNVQCKSFMTQTSQCNQISNMRKLTYAENKIGMTNNIDLAFAVLAF